VSAGVPLDELFPYGTGNGDMPMPNGDDISSPQLNLSVPFPFFNTLYKVLWVNVNGALSFEGKISTFTPTCAPVEREYSSIAVFWSVLGEFRFLFTFFKVFTRFVRKHTLEYYLN
jgi:hypothetical protein